MNNRDLLVNAARAAEIQGKYYVAYDERYINEGIDIGNGRLWNPLTHNEDAFSLMVKCQMTIRDNGNQIFADTPHQCKTSVYIGKNDIDREKYTRAVITKCAALIGGLDPSIFNNWCPTLRK